MTLFDGLRRLFGSPDDGEDPGGDDGGMVSCVEVKERLFEYLDGELADLSHEEVKRHIELCEECYPRFKFERNFLDALRAADRRGATSPELKHRLLPTLAYAAAH